MKKIFCICIVLFFGISIVLSFGDKQRIGIIDSYLDTSGMDNITEYISLGIENKKNLHGKFVYEKVTNNIEADVYYVNVEETLNGNINVENVAEAFRILREKKVDVINVSLAFPYLEDMLKEEVEKCLEDGIVIVAAVDNSDLESYPACYDNVIAVAKEGSTIEKKELVKLNEESCNSYRTAKVTNYIVKNKLCNENIDKIIKKLNEKYN